MANIEITNNETDGLVVWDPVYRDETLLDAATVTYPEGTVLGRITASGKLTKYTTAASDGSEVPVAVLTYDVDLVAATDKPARALISGRVREGDLLADSPARALTIAEVDTLRTYDIIAQTTQQLAEQDNQ